MKRYTIYVSVQYSDTVDADSPEEAFETFQGICPYEIEGFEAIVVDSDGNETEVEI